MVSVILIISLPVCRVSMASSLLIIDVKSVHLGAFSAKMETAKNAKMVLGLMITAITSSVKKNASPAVANVLKADAQNVR